jgi:hypothetical protein
MSTVMPKLLCLASSASLCMPRGKSSADQANANCVTINAAMTQ